MAFLVVTSLVQAEDPIVPSSIENINKNMKAETCGSFGKSNYPFFDEVNGCGGNGVTQDLVADKYIYKVTVKILGKDKKFTLLEANFRDACNNHDECYMTLGGSKDSCEAAFAEDLAKACYQGELTNFSGIVRNALTGFYPVGVCLGIVANYVVGVTALGYSFYDKDQSEAY